MTNKVFVAVVVDRHKEPYAELFLDYKKAINWVTNDLLSKKEIDFVYEDELTQDELNNAGWLFCKTYNVEGDYVYIEEKQIFL